MLKTRWHHDAANFHRAYWMSLSFQNAASGERFSTEQHRIASQPFSAAPPKRHHETPRASFLKVLQRRRNHLDQLAAQSPQVSQGDQRCVGILTEVSTLILP
jgi:hypothetical protein